MLWEKAVVRYNNVRSPLCSFLSLTVLQYQTMGSSRVYLRSIDGTGQVDGLFAYSIGGFDGRLQ